MQHRLEEDDSLPSLKQVTHAVRLRKIFLTSFRVQHGVVTIQFYIWKKIRN